MNSDPLESSSSGRERRLEQVLIECVEALEKGRALDRQELLARYPEFAAELAEFFESRDRIEQLAEPLRALVPSGPQKTNPGVDASTIGHSESSPTDPQVGTTVHYFGDYELLEEIARGGMGVVYKAKQVSLNRIVALKMILAGQFASAVEVQRFHSEAEAAANLDHPNIVPIYEVGEHEGRHYFSMKLIPMSRPLSASADQRQAALLVATVARAVHYAHQRGIIHRDLKPANILMDEQGQPHITDFGLAKRTEGDSNLSQSGAIVGTPAYMAPEQAAGKKGLTTAADVYSLGAILYELVTGKPPFVGSTPMDILLQVMDKEPVSPRQVQPGVDRDLETICLKCLAKDPQKRYGTAEALAEDLRRFQAGEPIQARPVGIAERAKKWVRRRPMVASLLTAVFVIAAVGLGAFAWAFDQTLDARDDAINEQKKTAAALNEAEAATKETKKQLRRAETLVVKVKFEQAFYQPEENRAFSMLSTAALLREADALEDRPLRDSLGLHLENWIAQVHRLTRTLSYKGMLSAVAFSPDGKFLLTVSQKDGTAQLWQSATGQQVGLPFRHGGGVLAVAIGPDGKAVLTGSFDRTARLWDSASGKPLGPPLQHQREVRAVTFSLDGKTVLTGSYDKTARLWDAATGKQFGPTLQHPGGVVAVAISPDGKTVLTGSDDNMARLWDAATGKLLGPPLQHRGSVMAAAFSPDGKTVLTGSFDRTAQLWDTATGQPLRPPLPHEHAVYAVAFSPDGNSALTGSGDKTGRLWDTASGKPLGAPLQQEDVVWAVAFSPNGKTVLTASRDKTARLWEKATGKTFGPTLQHQGGVVAVVFSPDGKTVLTRSDAHAALLWDTATGKPLGPPLQHQDSVAAVAFSPDGKTVLTGSFDRTARLWDTATGKQFGPTLQHQGRVVAVAFSPDGKTVLTGSYDRSARLWDTATGKPLGAPLQHQDLVVAAVAFSPDGKTVLTGSYDRTARLWDTATGQPLGAPLQHQDVVLALAFSPDGKTVLTACRDKTARLWETATGKPIGPPLQHQGVVMAVAFSPDGETVLTASHDKTARLWETAMGTPLGPPLQHQDDVVAVAFSPDGKTVVTGSKDKTARLWETATGKPLGPPMQHQGEVHAVAFAPDGKTVLTGSPYGTGRLWRVPRPIQGDPERILLWTQVSTGTELDEHGQVRVLDANTWNERQQQLEKLGGPPTN